MVMNEKHIRKKIEQIINDKTSGSTYIASKIENIFPFIPDTLLFSSLEQIIEAHSSMAAIINRINILCLQKEGRERKKKSDVSQKTYQRFWEENRNKKKWVTLSFSHGVIECFRYMSKKQNIIQGISYPDKEGVKSFNKLQKIHNVTLVEDNMLSSEIEKSDAVILGADLITDDFIVNKTGSFSLGLAAKYFNKPYYIISSGEKFLSEYLIPIYKLKTGKKNSQIIHYFEKVPKNWITKIYLTSTKYDLPISRFMQQLLLVRAK
jgi:translation initiation factor 2B subunit (eIF-2B alpha/beta/delta family)